MPDWSVARRIYGGFGVVIALVAVLAGVSLTATNDLKGQFETYHEMTAGAALLARLEQAVMDARITALRTRVATLRGDGAADGDGRAVAQIFDAKSGLEDAFEGQPEKLRRVRAIIENAASYVAAFDAYVGAASERDRAEAGAALDALGPKIQDALRSLMVDAQALQERAGAAGLSQVEAKRLFVSVAGGATLTLGAALAVFAATWIARDVRALSRRMAALAGGDLSVAAPRSARRHELAEMANALAVFKEDAARLRDMAAAEKARDAEAAEQRRRMMAELRDRFGGVVDAAVRGDLSGRIAADFPDAELNDLAAGVNRLLQTTNAGVAETARVLSRIAEGDLTERMAGDFQGAFADLQRDANATSAHLAGLIGELAQTAALLRRDADDIASGAAALSDRAEQQASSLQETAATMQEMSATIRTTAQNVGQASDLATDASGAASQGGALADEAVRAMSEIETSADQIGDIVSVIDGLAFQTNLLALNAAVEAARAGDSGKGFAVVASEVRDLARRSAEAAQDIRKVIGASSAQVALGVEQVGSARSALGTINRRVADLETSINDITSATREQSIGVDEVTAAVAHIDGMTQQNAALADESAGGAKRLVASAERLSELINAFTVDRAATREAA